MGLISRVSSRTYRQISRRPLSNPSNMFTRALSQVAKRNAGNVAVLGAAGGIGQPLSLLLKANPNINNLHLYDVMNTPGVAADCSHCDTPAQVKGFTGDDEIEAALTGMDLVIIPAGVPRTALDPPLSPWLSPPLDSLTTVSLPKVDSQLSSTPTSSPRSPKPPTSRPSSSLARTASSRTTASVISPTTSRALSPPPFQNSRRLS